MTVSRYSMGGIMAEAAAVVVKSLLTVGGVIVLSATALMLGQEQPSDIIPWVTGQAPGVTIAILVLYWKRESDKAKDERIAALQTQVIGLIERDMDKQEINIRALQEISNGLNGLKDAQAVRQSVDALTRLVEAQGKQ